MTKGFAVHFISHITIGLILLLFATSVLADYPLYYLNMSYQVEDYIFWHDFGAANINEPVVGSVTDMQSGNCYSLFENMLQLNTSPSNCTNPNFSGYPSFNISSGIISFGFIINETIGNGHEWGLYDGGSGRNCLMTSGGQAGLLQHSSENGFVDFQPNLNINSIDAKNSFFIISYNYQTQDCSYYVFTPDFLSIRTQAVTSSIHPATAPLHLTIIHNGPSLVRYDEIRMWHNNQTFAIPSPLIIPQITGFPLEVTVAEDSTQAINLSNYFTSLDNSVLTYSHSLNLNAFIQINNSIATITPTLNYFGISLLEFTAYHPSGGNLTVNVTLNVTPVDDPVTFVTIPSLFLNQSSGSNSSVFYLPDYLEDPDNDTAILLFEIISQSANNIANCVIDGLYMNCTSYNSLTGESTVSLNVTDGNFTDVGNFTLHVFNYIDSCSQLHSPVTYKLLKNISSVDTCISISSKDVILDCDGKNINYGTNTGFGIYALSKTNITIQNCGILQQGLGIGSHGIFFDDVSRSVIRNTTVLTSGSTSDGIHLLSSQGNQLMSNVINTTGSNASGIQFSFFSSNNVVNSNTIHSGSKGIAFVYAILSQNNSFSNNFIQSSASSILLSATHDNFIHNNTISASEILLQDSSNNRITSNTATEIITEANSHNTTIMENSLGGIQILAADDAVITGNQLSYCLSAVNTNFINIVNNSIGNCLTVNHSTSPVIQQNNIVQPYLGHALALQNTTNAIIQKNTITQHSTGSAVLLDGGAANTFIENTINAHDATTQGITLKQTTLNIIHTNNISSQTISILVDNANQNTVYNNHLHSPNATYVLAIGNTTNLWNTSIQTQQNIVQTHQTGGNYYTSPNEQGYSQQCSNTNLDSFCDQPLVHDQGNIDYFPLIDPKPQLFIQGTPNIGNTINLTLTDLRHPNANYVVGLSTMTQPPYVISSNLTVPLFPNSLFFYSINSPEIIGLHNTQNTTNALGSARASFTIPYVPSIVGLPVYFAYVTFNSTHILSIVGPETAILLS